MPGILDAMRTARREKESLDELAMLPQAMIMSMAQRGDIPKEDIAAIIGRKAEIIQRDANMKALRSLQGQGQPPTIMEQMMARTAEAEAPREMTDVGIASNPTRPMEFAGGGIVAFDKGGLTDEKRREYEKYGEPGSLRRMFGSIADYYTSPSSSAGIARNIQNTFGALSSTVPGAGGTGILSSLGRYLGLVPGAATATNMATAERRPAPVVPVPKEEPVKEETKQVIPPTRDEGAPAKKEPAKPVDPYAELKEMFRTSAEERAASRKEARDMALLEAGLNILGGESPYAMANIGKGAGAAARAYGEKMGALKKEEREARRDLAELTRAGMEYGQKERALDIQEKIGMKEPGELALVRAAMRDPKLMETVKDLYGARKADQMTQFIMSQMAGGGGKLDRSSLQSNIEKWKKSGLTLE